jgi:hypothetical protein
MDIGYMYITKKTQILYIMRAKGFVNDKGQWHGPWSMHASGGNIGYFEGYYNNGVKVGFWVLCVGKTTLKNYYAR